MLEKLVYECNVIALSTTFIIKFEQSSIDIYGKNMIKHARVDLISFVLICNFSFLLALFSVPIQPIGKTLNLYTKINLTKNYKLFTISSKVN